MSAAAKVIEQVRAIVAGRPLSADPTTEPARLEVGASAHRTAHDAAGWVSTHTGRLLPALYGVEVHQVDGITLSSWQLLDRSGSVVAAGVVEP